MFACGNLSMVAVDARDPDRLYVATRSHGVFVREPSGWELRGEASGLPPDSFGVIGTAAIAADPQRPGVVYAGSFVPWLGHSNGVFMSSDGGSTWRNINYNLGSELNAHGLHVHPRTGDLYLNSFAGLWRLAQPQSE